MIQIFQKLKRNRGMESRSVSTFITANQKKKKIFQNKWIPTYTDS